MFDGSILEGLNPQQSEAVTTTEGPLLILAGAGSGKTTVLTKRIAWILQSGLAQRSQILAVTFTNKAAREMVERIEGLCGSGFFPNAGTFHSVCARWLRREAKYLDVSSSFSIYDTESQIILMRSILKDLNIYGQKHTPVDFLTAISHCKNHKRKPDNLSPLLLHERTLIPVYKAYNQRLRENDSLDFDDILLYTAELFSNHPEVREKYQRHLRYIMVDEFQDVNPLQYELLRLILGEDRNFCAVGDDDQSIYGFRGADISIILRFEKDFHDAKVIKLEQNYRSTQQILNVANAVVSHNSDRKSKNLWSSRTDGVLPYIYITDDARSEALFVIQACKLLVQQCGYNYSDIAILYRSNFQSRTFEEILLREEGMSYQIVGGHRFYDRREIRDILAYLYVLGNPSDSVALGRIIQNTRGLGQSTLAKIVAYAASRGIPIMHALGLADQAAVPPSYAGRCRKLYDSLQEFSRLASVPDCSLTDLVRLILEDTGYQARLMASELEEDQERCENLRELLEVLSDFDRRFAKDLQSSNYGGESALHTFLNEISLISGRDEFDGGEYKKDSLVLMTIHTSKGLEFPVVFLVGMEDGSLPHHRSLADGDKGVEEERRLCYVGLTRAKDMLYLTSACQRGDQDTELSRFVYEMPLKQIEVKSSSGWKARAMEKRLTSGKPFRAADEELKEKHDQESGSERQITVLPPKERSFRRRTIAIEFPPGCTVRHKTYGLGNVTFIAAGKLWIRFAQDPSQCRSILCSEVERVELSEKS
ncbi:MAG: ATP-dependent helicase [Candidatus Bruticola sp.]